MPVRVHSMFIKVTCTVHWLTNMLSMLYKPPLAVNVIVPFPVNPVIDTPSLLACPGIMIIVIAWSITGAGY